MRAATQSMNIFTAALPKVAPNWKPPKCPAAVEWVDTLIHTVTHCETRREKGPRLYTRTRVGLAEVMLREGTQTCGDALYDSHQIKYKAGDIMASGGSPGGGFLVERGKKHIWGPVICFSVRVLVTQVCASCERSQRRALFICAPFCTYIILP